MTPPVLSLARVGFRYPGAARPALDEVTLEVGPGEGVALLGRNGAGKTTLIRLAMALLQPAAGEVRVAGRATRGLGPEDLAPVAGFLFQQPESQLFERTIAAELAFGPRQLGWDDRRIAERVEQVLARLGLAGMGGEHPYDLPLPRRRLVALGTAVAAEPALLLLDEPTAALDRDGRAVVAALVADHLAAGGAAVAVTHDARFAIETLGRSLVLEQGRLAADGATAEILAAPGSPLVLPPHAEVAHRLHLSSSSLRMADVAAALAAHCSGGR